MTAYLDKDMREFIAQITQFVDYVDDAMNSPELTDFDALNEKLTQIRGLIVAMGPIIGVQRKEKHAGRKNDSKGQAPTGPKGTRKPAQTVDAG